MNEVPLAMVEAAGRPLALRHRRGGPPTLMFLPGYASDMEGAKAVALDAFAAGRGLGLVRFDYSGTGSSGGDFAEGTLARWIDEAVHLLDHVAEGPVILAGSSMGGWIALHLALRRPGRIAAMVGIAAAPDFTEWGFDAAQRERLVNEGRLEEPNPYGPEPFRTYRGFWESGQALRLLEDEIAIDCPVRLVHGDADGDVPIAIAHRLVVRLRSADVQLLTIKGGGHRLSEPREIAAIVNTVDSLLETAP